MNQALGLDAFNFTLAGAREGFGPFLGVYLQHQGFDPARTGFAMSLAGLAGIAATAPLGALIDRITAKRAAVVLAVTCIAIGAGLIVASKQLWIVAAGQVFIGIADSSLAPLVAALTLGLVGREHYADRVARNEAFNHAGNAVNAALAALLGYMFGMGYVAAAIGVMAVATGAVILGVDPNRIDHEAARGGNAGDRSTWSVLWHSKPLLLLAGTVFAFQTANGAMLPFIAQALTSQGHDPSLTTGAMTVTAQVSMIGAALLVPHVSRRIGQPTVLGCALLLVILRAGLAAWSSAWGNVALVQVLEGLSMGLAGVAIPALVADIMADTGHAGGGLGGVMMAYGAGAALSPALAGLMAQKFGFPAAFVALGAVAAVGLALWIAGLRIQAGANRDKPQGTPSPRGAS
ncbi:MFS transporter [Lichenifustis flavocetrariae]|uniref:MFS transporter n=1 Tax=Lichenifustis flavocetrariae TaxID=2949735 RepID=A0AA41YY96_9HYPH|nr:MFS transporter [Lichenifustis flavocetrariae]MCW6509427.1 MFS transporter [Lichenifustis flavocetrariae]